jgi:DNA modification methylase
MTLHIGDAELVLETLPAGSVQCCVTSPPYYGLRDYGVEGQIGLEATPHEYVSRLVAVFAQIHRVLRDDGTLWIVLGDSYATESYGKQRKARDAEANRGNLVHQVTKRGASPKNLLGVPWRVAFALQDFGWILRQEIIWAKGNPMPESVRDRCTRSHETVFMLAKQRVYHYDHEAVKEPAIMKPQRRQSGHKEYKAPGQPRHLRARSSREELGVDAPDGKRNKRDVWHINTQPFKEAHFAVFPEKLIEPMILAGCPEGGTVLDPFFGAGTVGVVASRLNRKWIGIELNEAYAEIAERRIKG